jgi:uncharacterized protein YkwD
VKRFLFFSTNYESNTNILIYECQNSNFMKIGLYKKTIYSIAILAIFFSCFSFVYASEISRENIINLVNQSRTENQVGGLEENQSLDKAAEDKLGDMFKNNYFAHASPGGVSPWSWFEKNGYDYKYAGENLALGFSSVESEHKAWMESPTHKKNILNPNFKEIGVAVGKGMINNNLVTVAVQEFGSRFDGAVNIKEESNISDDKSKELLDKNKKDNKGVVLNTENSGSGNGGNNLSGSKPVGSNSFFSKFKDALLQDRGFLNNSIWITSITILSLFAIFGMLTSLMLVFHTLVIHLRKDQDIFKAVHSILVLLLIGFIIF